MWDSEIARENGWETESVISVSFGYWLLGSEKCEEQPLLLNEKILCLYFLGVFLCILYLCCWLLQYLWPFGAINGAKTSPLQFRMMILTSISLASQLTSNQISQWKLSFEIHSLIYCYSRLQTEVCITKSLQGVNREWWPRVPSKTTTFQRSRSFRATITTNSTSFMLQFL
jgi:hypothetical protein